MTDPASVHRNVLGAESISVTPDGDIQASDVANAIHELDNEKVSAAELPHLLGESTVALPLVTYTNDADWSPKYEPCVFDGSQYPDSASVRFRTAIMQTKPGQGQIWVRLYNMTTNTPVAGSEVSANLSQWEHGIEISGNLRSALSDGPALYCLEAKAASGFEGVIQGPALVVRY